MYFRNSRSHFSDSIASYLLIFWISSALFGLSFFLSGFFPLKIVDPDFADSKDIPTKLLNLSVDAHTLFKRHIRRFVFVVIDAFRWDFLENPSHMPYVAKLHQIGLATFLTARCHPPTATMPRIKALMTGSIPNYIDVVLNLGSDQMVEDNLIYQAIHNDLKVIFYGDEVWLNLFPQKFMRSEGTTSFFVSDFTEVDLNVTRHIEREMLRDDWDILILHYLGLDHIGHLAGPSSSLVPLKLKEMDKVIQMLHESLQKWDKEHPDQSSYLVVAGDHGMHDLGSHGGATKGEVLASLILIENSSHMVTPLKTRPEVMQIDLAATMAVLLGLPIPKSSLGVLIPYALKRLPPEQYLFALFYNAKQVSKQFLSSDSNLHSSDSYKVYLEAQNSHLLWLKNKSESAQYEAENLYFQATQLMSSHIVKNLVNFDLWALFIGSVILAQVLLSSLCWCYEQNNDFFINNRQSVFLVVVGGTALFLCGILFGDSLFIKIRWLNIYTFAVFLIVLNFGVMLTLIKYCKRVKWKRLPAASTFLRIGCILYVLSLSASSLIEEEHQTWYFVWSTLLLLVSIYSGDLPHMVKLQLILVLGCHRFLRKLNQTGDKWAHLPDIADWLTMSEHQIFLSGLVVSGLLGVWLSLHHLRCITNFIDNAFHCSALVCVLLYRVAVGDVYFFLPIKVSRGVWMVRLFWLAWVMVLARSLKRFKNQPSSTEALKIFISSWILSTSILLRPFNVILIPYLVFSSCVLCKVLKHPTDRTIVHSWLGAVVFYYQGNSNSLSSIDITTGYIGAEHQNIYMAGLLVFLHTYSFPVLAMLLLWLHSVWETDGFQRKQNIFICLLTSFSLRLLPLTFYCILIVIHRHHLFIWSVFAPKLLYESSYTFLSLMLLIIASLFLPR